MPSQMLSQTRNTAALLQPLKYSPLSKLHNKMTAAVINTRLGVSNFSHDDRKRKRFDWVVVLETGQWTEHAVRKLVENRSTVVHYVQGDVVERQVAVFHCNRNAPSAFYGCGVAVCVFHEGRGHRGCAFYLFGHAVHPRQCQAVWALQVSCMGNVRPGVFRHYHQTAR
jgi:hypothetical protein